MKSLRVAALLLLVAAALAPSDARAQCACNDGLTGLLGCCGGDGERICAGGGCDACYAPAEQVVFSCAVPRLAGQTCGPAYPCDTDLSCMPMPWEAVGVQRCIPTLTFDDTPYSQPVCDAMYSEDLHLWIIGGDGGASATATFGAGLAASLVASGTVEWGTAYSKDGRYGCYYTYCGGAVTNVAAEIFGTNVGYYDYDDFAGTPTGVPMRSEGTSWVTSQAASIIGGVVEFQVQSFEGGANVGLGYGATLGLGILPVEVGGYACQSEVITTKQVTPSPEQHVDFAFGGVEIGTVAQPWNTIQEALDALPPTGGILYVKGAGYSEMPTFPSNKPVTVMLEAGESQAIIGGP